MKGRCDVLGPFIPYNKTYKMSISLSLCLLNLWNGFRFLFFIGLSGSTFSTINWKSLTTWSSVTGEDGESTYWRKNYIICKLTWGFYTQRTLVRRIPFTFLEGLNSLRFHYILVLVTISFNKVDDKFFMISKTLILIQNRWVVLGIKLTTEKEDKSKRSPCNLNGT